MFLASLNVGNSKPQIKNIAEWMLRVGILSYPVSVPRIVGSSRTLSRGAIHKYRRRGHRTLSVNVYRFSQDLKKRAGRVRVHAFFVPLGQHTHPDQDSDSSQTAGFHRKLSFHVASYKYNKDRLFPTENTRCLHKQTSWW